MPTEATVYDRHGRRVIVRGRTIPDHHVVRVPITVMDGRSVGVHAIRDSGTPGRRMCADGIRFGPGYAAEALTSRDSFAATNSHERSQSTSESAREAYVRRTNQAWQQMPPRAYKPKPGQTPDSASLSPSEAAYAAYKARLSDAWRTPVADNAEGVSTTSENLPPDIAALPMTSQLLFCRAWNQYMEEHPNASEDDCESAGREALAQHGEDSVGPPSLARDMARLEDIRSAIHDAQKRRLESAWKGTR